MIFEKYIEKITSSLQKNKYIYGAGEYARGMYFVLKKFNIDINGFVVTDAGNNPTTLLDKPVYAINSINNTDNELFIICLKFTRNNGVISELKKHGYNNYIEAPENISEIADPLDKYNRPMIEITAKIGCSVNCKYCPQQMFVKNYLQICDKMKMSYAKYKSFLNKTPNNTIVSFAGFVEPFLHPDTVQMIKYAAEIGRDMLLYTTLVGVSENIFNEIKNIDFGLLVLHLPDEDNYANIPLTEEYFKVLDLFINHKKSNGLPYVDRANCQTNPHTEVLKHTTGKITVFSELNDRAGNLEFSNLLHRHFDNGMISCSRAKNVDHFILLPNGALALCCSDFSLKHIVGNLNYQSWEEVMDSKEMKYISECMDDETKGSLICRKCVHAKHKGN